MDCGIGRLRSIALQTVGDRRSYAGFDEPSRASVREVEDRVSRILQVST